MTEPIACNLIGNALDYLLLAGEQAREGSPRMLKHALATLADGVELLLKARLELYDWSLLFKNVDDADRDEFKSGDFQSVTFEQTVKRLKQICDVEVNPRHLSTLNALRVLRNKIRHFAVQADRQTAESLIARACSFAVDFVAKHLEAHLDTDSAESLRSLRCILGQYQGFVDARMKEIKAALDAQNYSVHVECPQCLQETLYAEEGESSCAFCGYRAKGEDAAAAWFDRNFGHILDPKDRLELEDEIMSCPECGAWACVHDASHGRICLACGESGAYEHCSRCGRLIAGEPLPGDHCQECWDQKMERD